MSVPNALPDVAHPRRFAGAPSSVGRWDDRGLRSFRTIGGHRRYRWTDVRAWIERET
jgi:hypothetical protein